MATARSQGSTRQRTTKPRPAAGRAGSAPGRARRGADLAVSSEERERMIREEAYLRAEQRGFAPGNEMADWLAAESEVDIRIGALKK
jgi:hypothetical protein